MTLSDRIDKVVAEHIYGLVGDDLGEKVLQDHDLHHALLRLVEEESMIVASDQALMRELLRRTVDRAARLKFVGIGPGRF